MNGYLSLRGPAMNWPLVYGVTMALPYDRKQLGWMQVTFYCFITKYRQLKNGPTQSGRGGHNTSWNEFGTALSNNFFPPSGEVLLKLRASLRSETAEAASGDVMLQIWMPNPPRGRGEHCTHTWQRLQEYRAGERGSLSRQNILLIGSKTARRVRLRPPLLSAEAESCRGKPRDPVGALIPNHLILFFVIFFLHPKSSLNSAGHVRGSLKKQKNKKNKEFNWWVNVCDAYSVHILHFVHIYRHIMHPVSDAYVLHLTSCKEKNSSNCTEFET